MRDQALHFEAGAHVRTADGKNVGTIDRIVFDDHAEKVTHIVVRKGVLFTEDRVISVHALEPTDDGFSLTGDVDPKDFPRFEESDFRLDPQTDFYVANPGVAIGAFGPIGTPQAEPHESRDRSLPEDSIALHVHSDVVSNDGERVGRINEIVADSNDDRALQIVVASGIGDREKRAIPASLVISIAEGEVHLSIGSSEFKEYATVD